MAIKTIFNPLLVEGFQKLSDVSNAAHVQTVQTTDGLLTPVTGSKAIAVGSVQSFITRVTAIEGATDDVFVHEYKGAIKRTSGGVTSLVDTVINETIAEDAGAATWSVTFTAGAGELDLGITGEAAHTIEWRIETVFSEIIY